MMFILPISDLTKPIVVHALPRLLVRKSWILVTRCFKVVSQIATRRTNVDYEPFRRAIIKRSSCTDIVQQAIPFQLVIFPMPWHSVIPEGVVLVVQTVV